MIQEVDTGVIQEVDTGVIQEVDWGFYGFLNTDYYGFSTYSGGKWRGGGITNPLFLLFAPFRQNFNSFLEPVNIEDFSPQILI